MSSLKFSGPADRPMRFSHTRLNTSYICDSPRESCSKKLPSFEHGCLVIFFSCLLLTCEVSKTKGGQTTVKIPSGAKLRVCSECVTESSLNIGTSPNVRPNIPRISTQSL